MNYLTSNFVYEGKNYFLTWIPGDSYNGLEPIVQAYGFCFLDNKLLVIKSFDFKVWQVPGGTPEKGETPEETLIREVEEEANASISDIHYLGAQKVIEENGKTYYQLRFAAKVVALNERKPDPDKGFIHERKLIDPKIFGKVSEWGEIGDAITRSAMEKLGIK